MNNYLIFGAGLVLLVGGGELMIRGAVAISRRFNLPALVVGALIIGFGTSTPELVASLLAVSRLDAPGVAMGNVIGSNVANILLIIGISAAIFPIKGVRAARRDLVALVASCAAVAASVILGNVSRILALPMVGGMVYYIISSARQESQDDQDQEAAGRPRLDLAALETAGGIAALLFGAHLMVTAAVSIAAAHGVPDSIIGLSAVALGTSLPELAASIIAAAHKQSALAVGNIIGSNIFNALLIPGAVGMVQPFQVSQTLALPFLIMTAATLALLAALKAGKISRAGGLVLVSLYVAYMVALF